MKKTRKFAAFTAAIAIAACSIAPMTVINASAASITINGITDGVQHNFAAYQIFTGTINSDGSVADLKWGSGVTSYDSTTVTAGDTVDSAIVEALGTDARAIAKKIVVKGDGSTFSSSGTSASLTGLTDGYYLVKDVTDFSGEDEANSAWIVQVAGSAVVDIKSAKPSVDKQVSDGDSWAETADHAIGEDFQFKLTATVPADADLAFYNSYALTFNDSFSEGLTFQSIESVTVSSATTLAGDDAMKLTSTQYTPSLTAATAGAKDWTLAIADLKALVNDNNLGTGGADVDVFGKEIITVEVIYNACLNSNAVVEAKSRADGDTDDTNFNSASLTYSNNPESTGTGETTEDYTWVFTYEVDNTKYKIEEATGNELAGAVFNISDGTNTLKFTWNSTKNAYVVDPNGSADVTSKSDGTFNLIGLDSGTYTLTEKSAPEGYNVAEDVEFTITGSATEDTAGDTVDLTLSGAGDGVENTVVDTKNSSLPSTGGIGTKLFYIGGGCLVGLAGVLLITKKRAKTQN